MKKYLLPLIASILLVSTFSVHAYTPTPQETFILQQIVKVVKQKSREEQLEKALTIYLEQGLSERKTYFAEYLLEQTKTETIQEVEDKGDYITYRVLRVVDGDTIKIEKDSETVSVRFIGIDSPEYGDDGYKQARDALVDLINGQDVRLEMDELTGEKDKYDRLLAYVYVGDMFVNEALLQAGVVREFSLGAYREQENFLAIQAELAAQQTSRRRYCSEFTTCEQAMAALAAGATELDGDGDGEPCESALCK